MGRWGRTLVESVQNHPGSGIRFTAGQTRSPEKVSDWARTQGIRLLDSYDAVLADPDVEAVVLATPHQLHAQQIIAAARAGKPVFTEKPFTLSKASAEAAVAACRDAGVVLALGHNRRFLPAVAEIRSMLADGRIGTLMHVEGQFSGPSALAYQPGMWRAERKESPLGGMGGMGIHMIDMMINLAGPIAEVSVHSTARVLANGLDDTTAMLCCFGSGATGTFATLAAAPRCWRIALYGSEGWVELVDHVHMTFRPREGEGFRRDFPPHDIERAELAAFAAAVAGGAAYPLPLDQAVHGVAVYEAMIASAAAGGAGRVVA
ncbi:Gfo/Idh/MocA family protein [Teichococcus oryzae]|nr:Gfo/Idh/MocA family oxidoreductase [Pseudoroseomonas oryzae]